MRVLYLDYTNSIGLGGGQRSLSLLVRHLDRGRFEPVVACPPGEKLREILDPSVPVRDLILPESFSRISRTSATLLNLPAAMGRLWGTVRRLKAVVSEERIDMIHANNLKMAVIASWAAPSLPLLWHVRDIYPHRRAIGGLLALASRAATKVLAVSQAVAHHLPDCSKTEVVYNAVELPELRAMEAIRPTIGFVGRLDAWKGIHVLVEAFGMVRRNYPNAELIVVGDGPEARLLSRPGITHIPFQANLDRVWDRIAIAATPSVEPDPFPRAVIEAMSHSKPVVASGAGGIPEAVADGETGLLVRPNRADELSSAFARLLQDPAAAGAMGAAGRRRCEQRYSVAAQQQAISRIYETVAGPGAGCSQDGIAFARKAMPAS